MSDPAQKCNSKHAPIEGVKTKKSKKIKHYLRQEKGQQKWGTIILCGTYAITYT